MQRLKGVFSRINLCQMGTVTLKDSPQTCADLLWFNGRYPLDISPSDKRRLARGRKLFAQREALAASVLTGSLEPRTFCVALPPRPYQGIATELLLQRRATLFADEMGLGKTLEAVCAMAAQGTVPAAVVVKIGIFEQWQRELARILPQIRVHCIMDTKGGALPPADVYLTTYTRVAGSAEHLAEVVNSLFLDEAHELRHRETQKYQACLHIARAVEAGGGIRCAMTGSPIWNYGDEMYSILNILEDGCLGGFNEFVREWCTTQNGKNRVDDSKAFGLYLRDQGLFLRRTREDVGLQLPPRTRVVEMVDTDSKVLRDGRTAAIELARLVIAGTSFHERGAAAREFNMRLRQMTGIAKAPAAAAFARIFLETGKPVIISAWHREVWTILNEALAEFHPVMFTGTESPKQKEASLTEFKRGDSKVLLMSLRSADGIDGLQGVCQTLIHAELDWTKQAHEQLFTRIYRPGQGSPTLEAFLVSDEGSDPYVSQINGLKSEQSEGVLNPYGVIQQIDDDGRRIRELAKDYLRQVGEHVPEVAPVAMMPTGT
jgi:superfamily II DNA or RNA helicase